MEIKPINKVRLIKGVPFSITYSDIIQFDSVNAQNNYFNSLEHLDFNNLTYTRNNGEIKVSANRETLLDYNYMSFTNSNYGNKTFYAFITGIYYVNPNTSLVKFSIDEWQTWCFNLTYLPSYIERKHCKRWNSDGTPVINTVPEDLEYGSEYITKDHQQYNDNVYWVCFITSLDTSDGLPSELIERFAIQDVPTITLNFYVPIYHGSSHTSAITKVKIGSNTLTVSQPNEIFRIFRNNDQLSNKLISAYIVEEPPFNYTYTYDYGTETLTITPTGEVGVGNFVPNLSTFQLNTYSKKAPARIHHTYPKYGTLKNYVSESKLLMYPYSFVQLVDGQGNNFIIKPEYLNDNEIEIVTYTSSGLNNKLAHIVQNYRQKDVQLDDCRWELQNGIISNSANNLTIIDGYSSAYLQGQANTIQTNISYVQAQSSLNNQIANRNARVNSNASLVSTLANTMGGFGQGASQGGLQGGAIQGISNALGGTANVLNTMALQGTFAENTELQGNLTNERAIAMANAKLQDAERVADNVSLQGGNVYFTFQNQFNGYCLVYRQISQEYIDILQNYFQKYGYAYHRVEKPVLKTRQSWDYIRTVGMKIKASINQESIIKLEEMFNRGVTIWHTTDVGNYNLSNNEI